MQHIHSINEMLLRGMWVDKLQIGQHLVSWIARAWTVPKTDFDHFNASDFET